MAKDKTRVGVPNKHLHARISYLHQAATYLSAGQDSPKQCEQHENHNASNAHLGGTETPNDTLSTKPPVAASSKRDGNNARQHATEPDCAEEHTFESPTFGGLPLLLSSHMAQVARKSQIRLHSSIKHAICKRCTTPLVEGQTCTRSVENRSRGGRKPHADMLVVTCLACGALKRWPVGAERQQRKTARRQEGKKGEGASAEGMISNKADEIMQMIL